MKILLIGLSLLMSISTQAAVDYTIVFDTDSELKAFASVTYAATKDSYFCKSHSLSQYLSVSSTAKTKVIKIEQKDGVLLIPFELGFGNCSYKRKEVKIGFQDNDEIRGLPSVYAQGLTDAEEQSLFCFEITLAIAEVDENGDIKRIPYITCSSKSERPKKDSVPFGIIEFDKKGFARVNILKAD